LHGIIKSAKSEKAGRELCPEMWKVIASAGAEARIGTDFLSGLK
jgi:hypothetical protein